MAYLALVIAIAAAGAGAYLWRVDARQRAEVRELEAAGDGSAPETTVPSSGEESEEGENAAAPPVPEIIDAEVVEEIREVREEDEEEGPAEEGEKIPAEPEPEPEPDPEPEDEPAPKAVRPRPSGLHLPGLIRRERRSWAEANGFTFTRRDAFLVDEWSRGAAATGAPARDIVSGGAYGHELLLMDLGGVNVMAMRTGKASDVVVDMRRVEFDDPDSSGDDLIRVQETEGFRVYATEAGVGKRLVDVRVTTALSQLPESVTAVWMESDWVLAQTTPASRSGDWDAMLAPLALLADAARVLPPQEEDVDDIWVSDFTPSRPVAHPVSPERLAAVPPVPGPDESELVETPPVVRPEEPLELPTRTRAEYRGTVPPRALGVDDVEAIADGRETDPGSDGTRILRRFRSGPSIFGDGEED
ncbi:hypothetical protein [Corynebacterium guangdongense]|uniref:Secreted or membrane protein n=1 Tax=Corynebacterium guangdongense TaxID=1783348 RepID=A0ABU2A042_9CORY|nr:hypothetical protein [Corynebacterium guangdongense]MDR7330365.1 hypothetical protein [Corynebacterium guangdongense]WJZ18923.1 hypothetical protein CGUA_11935 [Corynebacterium guangdongense]